VNGGFKGGVREKGVKNWLGISRGSHAGPSQRGVDQPEKNKLSKKQGQLVASQYREGGEPKIENKRGDGPERGTEGKGFFKKKKKEKKKSSQRREKKGSPIAPKRVKKKNWRFLGPTALGGVSGGKKPTSTKCNEGDSFFKKGQRGGQPPRPTREKEMGGIIFPPEER